MNDDGWAELGLAEKALEQANSDKAEMLALLREIGFQQDQLRLRSATFHKIAALLKRLGE